MEEFLKYLKKEYGDDVLYEDDTDEEFQVISTGSLALDVAIGVGGIPKTKFTEIYGSEGTGKTTLSLELSKNAILNGDNVLYVDVENMLDMVYVKVILGDLYDPERFVLVQPETGESALMIVEDGLKLKEFGLIIVDSIGALAPKKEKEKNLDDSTVGETARLLSKFFRRTAFFVRRNQVAVVLINQVRDKVGGYVSGFETPGGHALKHYLSVRVALNKGQMVKVGSETVGTIVPFIVRKNKVGVPYRSFTFPIKFGEGIDKYDDALDFSKMLGVVKTRGPYYTYGDERLGQGRLNAIAFLKDNQEVYDRIVESCYNVVNGVKELGEVTTEDDEN